MGIGVGLWWNLGGDSSWTPPGAAYRGQGPPGTMAGRLQSMSGVTLAFSDFKLSRSQGRALYAAGVTLVVCTYGGRYPLALDPPGAWEYRHHQYSHAELGGVTAGRFTIRLAFRIALSPQLPPQTVCRAASTVLDDTIRCRYYRRAPGALEAPRLCLLSPGVSHGQGLLPHPIPSGHRVLLSCVGCPTNKWGLRPVTLTERFGAYDWPSDQPHPAEFPAFLVPGAVFLRGLPCLLGTPHGGGSFSRFLKEHLRLALPPPLKRSRDRELHDHDYELDETDFVRDRCVPLPPPSKRFRPGVPTPGQREALAAMTQRMGVQASTPALVASREDRERKATKSDDAGVPLELWTQHFLEAELGKRLTAAWSTEDLETRVTSVFERIRQGALFFWKRSTTRSFLRWLQPKLDRQLHDERYMIGGYLSVQRKDERGVKLKTPKATLVCYPGRGLLSDLTWDNVTWTFAWKSPEGQRRFQQWSKGRRATAIRDVEVGRVILHHVGLTTWWEWAGGSTLFYWRWPREYQLQARDGQRFHIRDELPNYMGRQSNVKDPKVRELVMKKLQKVVARRYIVPGPVLSLTSYFHVPKGEDDIRMVYDGTKSGFNDALWAPRFGLPTVNTLLRSLDFGYFMSDVDVGEMFLNYPLHPTLKPYVGIDLTPFFGEVMENGKRRVLHLRWDRSAMGLTTSPYQAGQGMGFLEEEIRGCRSDPDNVFRWDVVRLNLPGSVDYTPTKPWVYKWRSHDNSIAADMVTYVDDIRPSGKDRAEGWAAARRVGSKLNWYGSQDAPRKRRDSSQTPGAWTGAVVWTNEGQIRLLVSQDKWDKTKSCVAEIALELEEQGTECFLSRKRLEQIRGFLNFVFQVYVSLRPHLVGFHLTIDGWRPGRDDEGWRMSAGVMRYDLEPKEEEEAPTMVRAVPRLKEDIKALEILCSRSEPPVRTIRCSKTASVFYGFGDASLPGFGASFQIGKDIVYQYGEWATEEGESNSSNWRELANLVRTLERLCEDTTLVDAELFVFTDNATAEACWWKGTSKSRKLFDLVLSMRQVEMEYNLKVHVIHVSGKRMINQGTDGLSRGDHSSGVMRGQTMLDFIPLHLNAIERSQMLEEWMGGLDDGSDVPFKRLKPEEWFVEGHLAGNFIWTPPPAATDVVVEQLAKAICPGNQISTNTNGLWKNISGYCRELSCRKALVSKGAIVCANYSHGRGNFAPCKGIWCPSCYTPKGPLSFPVRRQVDEDGVVLEDNGQYARFEEGRPGDNLMTPFQCDGCHFRNIQGREPNWTREKDRIVMCLIRRANLDAFWAREPSTVAGNLAGMKRLSAFEDRLGLQPVTGALGPFPLEDVFGMGIAIAVLDKSLDRGVHERHVQYETFRKLRSVGTNVYQAGVNGLQDSVGAYERNRMWISKVPTHSFWFSRFMTGVHKRVGDVRVQDRAVTIEVMRAVEEVLEELWSETMLSQGQGRDARSTTEEAKWTKKRIAEMGAWFTLGFCGGLRGEEMKLIEFAGTRNSLRRQTTRGDAAWEGHPPDFDYVITGRTKGKQLSGQTFPIPCVWETEVNHIQLGKWGLRLVEEKEREQSVKGRLFQRKLNPPALHEFEEDFMVVLEKVQAQFDVIEPECDVREEYGILRSLRRGMTAHCVNSQVSRELIQSFNRWQTGVNAEGKMPTLEMIHLYSDLRAIRPTLLKLTQGL